MTREHRGESESNPRLNRRTFIGLGIGAGVAATMAACNLAPASPPAAQPSTPAKPSGGAEPKLADAVTVALRSVSSALDPHSNAVNANFLIPHQIYDTLVVFDAAGQKILPSVAHEWKRIDPTTVEFKLRDDVKFSNGEGLTAETVKFNVDRVTSSKDPGMSNLRQRMGEGLVAEVVSNTTVRIKTKQPDPLILHRLTQMFIGPEKYIKDGGDLNIQPIGSGPFKVTGYEPSNYVDLEAFEAGWRAKPATKTLKIRGIGEPAARIAALKTGEVDIAGDLAGVEVVELRNDFNVQTQNAGSATVVSLLPLIPEFKDKRVRQALNYAVNKEEMAKALEAGLPKVAQGQLLQPGMLGYDDSLKAYPYDPEKAKSMLKEAGITKLDVAYSAASVQKRTAEAVSGYLKEVGITTSIHILEPAVFLKSMATGFDSPLFNWDTYYWYLHDFDAAAQNFAIHPQPRFDNEEFKKLYLQQRTELDEQKRGQIIKQAAKLMREESPCIFLWWGEIPVVANKKVGNLVLTADRSMELWKLQKSL